MPLVFTRDQIRAYLKKEGYAVNENELDAFIHDLKKVVKYEDRKRRRKRLGHESEDTKFETTTESRDEDQYYLEEDEEDEGVHSSSDSPTTFEESEETGEYDGSSETNELLLRQTVKLYHPSKPPAVKSRDENELFQRSSMQETASSSRSHIVMNRKTLIVNGDKEPVIIDSKVPIPVNIDVPDTRKEKASTRGCRDPVLNSSTIKPLKPCNRAVVPLKSTVPNKLWDTTSNEQAKLSKRSSSTTDELMILLEAMDDENKEDDDPGPCKRAPIGPPDSIKRDPVALYHFYKAIWDKQKRPGENRHMKLRWNVRVQTVGKYPCINGHPIKYLRQ